MSDASPLLLLASDGYQSLLTLRELLARGQAPAAIALAGGTLRPATPSIAGIAVATAAADDSLVALAARHHIPLVDGRPEAILQAFRHRPPGLMLASCYPWRLPDALLGLPQHGCFNLHPSALPDYRGPSPIFWQLRDGISDSGVSVHRMSSRFDRGALLCRQPLSIPDGSDYADWVRRLTIAGVSGFLQHQPEWLAGRIELTPQSGEGSYQGWPQPDDFMLDTRWPVRRIHNFLCGTAALGRARLQLPGHGAVELGGVLAYDADSNSEHRGTTEVELQAARRCVQFRDRHARLLARILHRGGRRLDLYDR